MRHVADRPGLAAGQVAGQGSVELFVDLLLLHRLAQLLVLLDRHHRYHLTATTNHWLEDHPRIRHAFIPKGACWLNLQEGWWRIFRRQALAGQSFPDPDEIAHATEVATAQLNARARPWIWSRPQPKPRSCGDAFMHP
jgi:hypothetical protein